MTSSASSFSAGGTDPNAGGSGPGHGGAPAYVPRRAWRSVEDRMVGGVASGLAAHLGVEVLWVRLGFLVAAFVGGLGVAMYAGLWMTLPAQNAFGDEAPGLAAAGRQGRRARRGSPLSDAGPLVALAALGVGAAVLVSTLVGNAVVVWPLLVAVLGIAVLWRQADEAQRERWVDSAGRIDPLRAVVGRGGWASWARLALGVGLLVLALVLFALGSGTLVVARDLVVATALGVVGLGLTVGPWLFRLAGDLSAERAERVRSQERADVAAHLHDSVLQTLALVQKHAEDPAAVARLARAQERDLRSWLYGGDAGAQTVAAGLRAAAAEVEDAHGVPVEVVVVGEPAALGERTRPVVLAAREAMANAARHSGAAGVDVYAEAGGGVLEVFVRDRGVGFDPHAVPDDRLGVRGSIVDRMDRHGGSASVRTGVGTGTEIVLRMPVGDREPPGGSQWRGASGE